MSRLPPELFDELASLVELDAGTFSGFDEVDDIDDGRIIVGSRDRDTAFGGFYPGRLRELERRGLIEYGDAFRLTDKGRAVVRAAEDLSAPAREHRYTDVEGVLEHLDLHPAIDRRVRRAFEHDDPQQAVRDAVGEIEVQIKTALRTREVAATFKSPADLVTSMFKPGGPLANPDISDAEQVGVMQLYQGAIAAIRNPNAHGRPAYTPDEALRLVIVADHLLRTIPGAAE